MIRHPDGLVASRIEKVGPKKIFTSIIVASELRYGCAKKGSSKLLSRVEGLLEILTVLPLDIPVDAAYGKIRAELDRAGQPIGMNDLLIAAHTLAHGLTLVTDNMREFSRIRRLKVENWLER